MAKNYIQDGKVMDWINDTGSDVLSDAVVVFGGNMLGVALVDIPDGATGSVALEGVFEVPKVAGVALAQGAMVAWVVAEQAVSDAVVAPGDISAAGTAFRPAAGGDTSVQVKLNGFALPSM